MIFSLVVLLDFCKGDIATELTLALEKQKMGKIKETQKFFEDNLSSWGHTHGFVNKYIEFLVSIGDYKTVMTKYGHLKEDLVRKAKEYMTITYNQSNYRDIAKLISVSGYSLLVLKSVIRLNLIDNNLAEAAQYIRRALTLYTDNNELILLNAIYLCITGDINGGVEMLYKSGNNETANNLKKLYTEYVNYSKNYTSKDKMSDYLKTLYHRANSKEMSDFCRPSVYRHLKYSILKEYLTLATELGQKDSVSLALTYHKYATNDESCFYLIMSYIASGNLVKAEQEYKNARTLPKKYKLSIDVAFDKYKKKEYRGKDHRENDYEYYNNSSSKEDFLGYYKLLGVDKQAKISKVKQAYVKLVKKNKNNTSKEWEKQHAKINKAYSVLKDEKKRQMYDNGIDPDNQHVNQGYQRGPENRYQHFSTGGFHFTGDFEELFANFGHGGRRQYHQRRYYWV